jgi:hypothetical protein
MHENKKHWDPFLGCYVYWSTWLNGRAEVVPAYVSKFRVWRPVQQRPRDGTMVRHRTGGLKRVS